jgi:hypothetical protein
MRRQMNRVLGLAMMFSVATVTVAAPPAAPTALIEVESNRKKYEGKVILNLEEQFWLMQTDGRIHELRVSQTQKFRQLAPKFSPASTSHLAGAMTKELGKGFQVATSRHYVVAAASGEKAKQYSNVLEDTYRAFRQYFSVRGLKLSDPEVPMIAIVFPTQGQFTTYSQQDRVASGQGLAGYYSPLSNRVALFEAEPQTALRLTPDQHWSNAHDPLLGRIQIECAEKSRGVSPFAWGHFGKVTGDLNDTLVHEAIHQAAFNTGLHPRLGPTPRWVVEGLATVFEAPGIRNSGAIGEKARINPERKIWFGNYAKTRRKEKSLEAFLSSDKLFDTNTLDAYAEAWALSFYLIEKRPRDYAKFLARMAGRSPLAAFTEKERLEDFRETISKDLPLIEAEMLRHQKSLK